MKSLEKRRQKNKENEKKKPPRMSPLKSSDCVEVQTIN